MLWQKRSDCEMSKVISGVEIGDTWLKCPDGTTIDLANIREVSAPKMIIGRDPSLQPGTIRTNDVSGGVIHILYLPKGINGQAARIMVRVSNYAHAEELVGEIQKARKQLKSGAEQDEGKVVVGECENCHRELRVKAHAVKKEMHLTCKCGHANTIHPPESLIK
jgi:hypothetical protein